MKAMELIKEIRGILGVELSEKDVEKTSVELANATLKNGTEIEFEKLEAGESVFIVTEDEGEKKLVALPVGEYEIEEKILVVSEEGVIGEIKEAEKTEEKEDDKTEEVEASDEAEEKEEEKIEAEYVTKEEFVAAVKEIKAMVESLLSNQEMKQVEVEAEKVETSEQKPEQVEMAAEPITHNPEAEAETKFNFAFQENTMNNQTSRIKSILNKL